MTDLSGYGRGTRMSYHSPLSEARAEEIISALAARAPASVVDYGCGWGELLLRIAEAVPESRATGIDIFAPDIERGRTNAAERGLAHRVDFIEGSAGDHLLSADLVLNSGAYQAFGTVEEALKALRALVNPGGCLYFGAEYWERTPSEEQLANLWPGSKVDDCHYLPDLVDIAVAAGFRPLSIQTATRAEWEEFESRYAAGSEEWLLANGGHTDADAVREKLDATRNIWLRGHRDLVGFAMLTLGVPH